MQVSMLPRSLKMSQLKQLVESFQDITYPKVTRSERGNKLFLETTIEELESLLKKYKNLTTVDHKARLLRDAIDFYLRRYHKFAIEGAIGAHYRETSIDINDCDFEHVIPQKIIRDMLIQGNLNLIQALNPPTCYLHKDNHKALKQSGWDSKTPSIWNFFKRYTNTFSANFETYNGKIVTDDWNLDDHYLHFNIK